MEITVGRLESAGDVLVRVDCGGVVGVDVVSSVKDIYPDLIVTEIVHDDFLEYRLKFSNGKPGSMVVRIDTIDISEVDDRYMPSKDNPVSVRFEASNHWYNVADIGTMKEFIEAIDTFVNLVVSACWGGDENPLGDE